MMGREKTTNTDRKAKSLIPLPPISEESKDSTSQASQGSFDNIDPADLPKRIEPIDLPDKIESSDSSYCSTTEKMTSEDESKRKSQKFSALSELKENSKNEKIAPILTTALKRKRTDESSITMAFSKPALPKKRSLHRSADILSGITLTAFWRDQRLSQEHKDAIEKTKRSSPP